MNQASSTVRRSSTQQQKARPNPNGIDWISVAAIVALFSCSGLGVILSKTMGNETILYLFIGVGLAVVPIAASRRPVRLKESKQTGNVAVFVLGLFMVFTSAATSGELNSFLRGVILVAIFICTFTFVPRLNGQDIFVGLSLYPLFEIALVLFTLEDWNPNASSQRLVVAGLVALTVWNPKWGMPVAAITVGVAMSLASRTSVVSFFSCLLVILALRWKRVSLSTGIGFVVISLVVFTMYANDFGKFVESQLGNNHPVAQFFLSDKSAKKLRTDPLDRMERAWKPALKSIRQTPMLGLGPGNSPRGYRNFRAHNVYLQLAMTLGIPSAILWTYFYVNYVVRIYRKAFVTFTNSKLHKLRIVAVVTGTYMLISGLLETSGLLSLGMTTNYIFLSLLFWDERQLG